MALIVRYHVHSHSHSGNSSYIHPGDALVILSGALFGPVWGFLIAGIGSCLADLLGGYLTYVPITFLIKGLVAFFSALAFQKLAASSKKHYLPLALGGIADIVLVAGGYFLFEFFLYGQGTAAQYSCQSYSGNKRTSHFSAALPCSLCSTRCKTHACCKQRK